MKRFYHLLTLWVMALATLLFTGTVVAAPSGETPVDCSYTAFQGAYAFFASPTVVVGQGTVIAIPEALLANSPVMLASQGMVQVDGQGQVVLTATYDTNGAAMTATTYAGSYTMTDGCNATMTLENGVWFTVRLVNTNDQPHLVSTTPGFVLIDQP